MKKKFLNKLKLVTYPLLLVLLLFLVGCNGESDDLSSSEGDFSALSDSDIPGSQQGSGDNSGKITAGEWNDLNDWSFWTNILDSQDHSDKAAYWSFYTNNRISVLVSKSNNPVINATVELKHNNILVWSAKTDNFGIAELWVGLFQKETSVSLDNFELYINNEKQTVGLTFIGDGVVEVEINSIQSDISNKVELAFIVDATGSMGDELEFLKDDLKDVIERVENDNSALDILTATVFYRDEGDSYLVKHSGFTNEINATLNFINNQSAGGGGDFPEAVHTALNETLNELQWSVNSKTRIAFLLLDAPPHYTAEIIDDLHSLIKKSANMGIKLIPITASGIDKETEFLMRFFSVSTNGTYVFITNDSGIGNDHIEASVGAYQVENLNDLIVRLINKYSVTVYM